MEVGMKCTVGAMLALGLVLTAGCDAVKVPGVEREPEPAGPPPATTPEPPEESPDRGPQPAVEAETPEPGTTPAPTPTPQPGTESEPAPSETVRETPTEGGMPGEPGDPSTPPDPAEPGGEIRDLAEINAAVCGLPVEEDVSLTVAQLTGAEEPSSQESLVGTAAVGGIAARLTAFPGIVKMERRRATETGGIASGHCGATRISRRWFVTAAHCVDQTYDEIRLIMGVENIRDTEAAQIVTADMSICHRAYDGMSSTLANDIALIRLPEEAVDGLAGIPIANVGETEKPLTSFNYPLAEMAGWGLTGFNASLSPVLLSAPLDIVSSGPAQIVVASREGAGPCVGDSGGPLYVTETDGKKVVVGVLSVVEQNAEGAFCEGEYRGRYTNLQGFADWMDAVMTACDANETLCQ